LARHGLRAPATAAARPLDYTIDRHRQAAPLTVDHHAHGEALVHAVMVRRRGCRRPPRYTLHECAAAVTARIRGCRLDRRMSQVVLDRGIEGSRDPWQVIHLCRGLRWGGELASPFDDRGQWSWPK